MPSRQPSSRPHLQLRAAVVQSARAFFTELGYLEVETPCRVPVPIPEAHIEAVPSDGWVLQPSPEICMKRLLATGHERIFQICKCFRSRERGRHHLPEFTLLEWYTAGHGHRGMMDQCEALIRFIAQRLGCSDPLTYQGLEIRLGAPWERVTVAEAFSRFAAVSVAEALSTGRFDDVMGLEIAPRLGKMAPVFLFDYPAQTGGPARPSRTDPRLVERFELFMGGLEICNGYSESTDAGWLRKRLEAERRLRENTGKKAHPLPEKFIDAHARMPDAAGNALGVDRLVMLFADAGTIDDVVAFTPEAL